MKTTSSTSQTALISVAVLLTAITSGLVATIVVVSTRPADAPSLVITTLIPSNASTLDVDECLNGLHTCNVNQSCVNLPDTFACHDNLTEINCPSTNLLELDECALETHLCDQHASCQNTDDGYNCTCDTGWEGSGLGCGTCANINECETLPYPCTNHSDCLDTPGSYVCQCYVGYELTLGVCEDVDECANSTLHTCGNFTVCVNFEGGFDCVNVDLNITGEVDECLSGLANCSLQELSCRNTLGGFECYNASVDECSTGEHDCDSQAVCQDTLEGFECVCSTGFEGAGHGCGSCLDIDECESLLATCPTHAFCRNTPGSFACPCAPGFELNETNDCVDIDECGNSTTHVCAGPDITCVNAEGSYMCVLDPALDIDECLGDICPLDLACENTLGSFQCVNRSVNECESGNHTCDEHATCVDTLMGYECTCNSGWTGTGEGCDTCTDVDECEELVCQANAECLNTPGSALCVCIAGFASFNSTSPCGDLDECGNATLNVCTANTTCVNTEGSYLCVADPDLDADECIGGSHDCVEGLTCENTFGSFVCTNHSVDQCALGTHNCDDQAVCTDTLDGWNCTCNAGYTGSGVGAGNCTDIDECLELLAVCQANSTCVNIPGTYNCSCDSGFQANGSNSCIDVNECLSSSLNVCQNGTTCVNTEGAYYCLPFASPTRARFFDAPTDSVQVDVAPIWTVPANVTQLAIYLVGGGGAGGQGYIWDWNGIMIADGFQESPIQCGGGGGGGSGEIVRVVLYDVVEGEEFWMSIGPGGQTLWLGLNPDDERASNGFATQVFRPNTSSSWSAAGGEGGGHGKRDLGGSGGQGYGGGGGGGGYPTAGQGGLGLLQNGTAGCDTMGGTCGSTGSRDLTLSGGDGAYCCVPLGSSTQDYWGGVGGRGRWENVTGIFPEFEIRLGGGGGGGGGPENADGAWIVGDYGGGYGISKVNSEQNGFTISYALYTFQIIGPQYTGSGGGGGACAETAEGVPSFYLADDPLYMFLYANPGRNGGSGRVIFVY